jgi:hypothetical protein
MTETNNKPLTYYQRNKDRIKKISKFKLPIKEITEDK